MTDPNVPEGSVIITPAQVYDEVRELTREVRDLITADKAEQRERSELANRIKVLEDWRGEFERKLWLLVGCAIGGSGGASALVQYFAR